MRTLRPAILPNNRKFVTYPLVAGMAVAGTGAVLGNPIMAALPAILLAAFPGLPILFHSVYHFFVQFQILADRLVVIDRVSDPFVRTWGRHEIRFGEIEYCFYVDKEAHLLMNLLKKLKPYKVPTTEKDYRGENLLFKYQVPGSVLDEFERSSQKTLNDDTATGVILEVEKFCDRNNIPKEVKKEICKGLEKDEDLNFDYVQEKLSPYAVHRDELERLRDEFSGLDTSAMAPFLVTKIDLKKLSIIESTRHPHAGIGSRGGLVLSNKDGTKKVYLMHFRNLNRQDQRALAAAIRDRTNGVTYLMTQKEAEALLQ